MRRLPPLDALRTFEAAARHLSFTRAADEIHVTQGAVSHRIRDLELQLQTRLFRRLTRSLALTGEGETLAAAVRRGLDEIVGGIQELDSGLPCSKPLRISAPPCFAERWLVPRLGEFHDRHPEMGLRLLTECGSDDLHGGAVDVAIRFGQSRDPDLHVDFLMADTVLPVCSPTLLRRHGGGIDDLDALAGLPLLDDATAETDGSGADWASWFAHAGRPDLIRADVTDARGQRFSDAALVVEAAAAGLGVALGRSSLLARDLACGRLVAPLPLRAPTRFSYWLSCLPEAAGKPRVAAFRAWLLDQALENGRVASARRTGARLRLLQGVA